MSFLAVLRDRKIREVAANGIASVTSYHIYDIDFRKNY